MPGATGRFRRADRILRSGGFRRVMGRGKRISSRNFVVFVDAGAPALLIASSGQTNDGQRSGRVGITVSKRVGNAVMRNHIKRRIREWYRRTRCQLPIGAEIVVIARRPARDLETSGLSDDLDLAVRKYRASGANEK